jgi:hypothetical protein
MIRVLWLCAGLVGDVDAGVPRPVEVPVDVDAGVVDAADAGDVDAGVVNPRAAAFAVRARVEPDPVAFGGPVELVVTLTRPAKQALTLPDALEENPALPVVVPLRRLAREVPGATPKDTRVEETLRVGFLALDVKDLKTPAFIIKADDIVLEVPSLPVRVDVKPIDEAALTEGGVPDGAVVVDAAAPALVYPVRDDRPFYALVVVVVGAALFFALRAWRKRARVVAALRGPPPPPPRPAHEVALERLDALMPLLQQGEVTLFVEKMMDEVLRDYLAGRFALPAGARTTKEIVTDLLGVAATSLDVGLVEDVGKDADLVKFARANLSSAQAHAMAGRVRALILATAAAPSTSTATATTTATTTATSTTPPSTTRAP